jgi:hypothetical protein
MPRLRMLASLIVVIGVCAVGTASFAKPAARPKCGFNGDYSFFFWAPGFSIDLAGVGFFTVQLDPATKCRSGVVLPGGIVNCNFTNEGSFEDFIESGSVFLESDGEGTMVIETNSSDGICDTGDNALELDISVVQGGKSVLFNSNGVANAESGTTPNAGYEVTITGRADRCFPGQISGCYDVRFWSAVTGDDPSSAVGDCTICVNGAGAVTGGTCRCTAFVEEAPCLASTAQQCIAADDVSGAPISTLSEIEGGGYTLGENCQSSTGYLWIATSSDEICGRGNFLALDFAVAQQGKELIGACDTDDFILNNSSEFNAGVIGCAFEGWLQ